MTARIGSRLDWVDIAKGICIVLVVLMHATHGVEKALGHTTLIDPFIEWARPFRLPDFFLISGLFLAARIDRPWRQFLDGKVVHFAYFYVLWTHILIALKAPGIVGESGVTGLIELYLSTAVRPFGPIWFLYLLAVYCAVTKLLVRVPAPLVLGAAVVLHCAAPATGAFLIDEFANRFVFFYAGYALSPMILAFAARVGELPRWPVAAWLVAWAALNAAAVTSGAAAVPGLDLVASGVGIAAVIAFSVRLAGGRFGAPLVYLGRNTIGIYVAFTIFMSGARVALLKLAPGLSGEVVALAATAAGVIGPLVAAVLVRGTALAFLFERPAWSRLEAPARHMRAAAAWVAPERPSLLPAARLALATRPAASRVHERRV